MPGGRSRAVRRKQDEKDDRRTVGKITVSLPPRVVKKIDEYAAKNLESREKFLRRFVDVKLDELRFNHLAFCLDLRQNRPRTFSRCEVAK